MTARTADRVPPHAFFVGSAVFHYLGPSFAVLLFAAVDELGVAWLRIASAAVVFAVWRRPWRTVAAMTSRQRVLLVGMGATLAAMNACFYLAIGRLPLGTVGALEFLGPVVLAAVGVRTRRNLLALLVVVGGVVLLTDVRIGGEPVGFVFAFANCALFALYVVLGHALARNGGGEGVDRLAASMLVALVFITPAGLGGALPALAHPLLLAAGVGVGVSSSVVPYVCDQLAMARLRRSTFALMLALLPATATVIGLLVLRQVPTVQDVAAVALVVAGVAVHRDGETASGGPGEEVPAEPGPDQHDQQPRHEAAQGHGA
ncbi:MAG: EamA family transporter [Acidothermales bacterium]|nr:EamA family transporter [Acidothermales bacterium]